MVHEKWGNYAFNSKVRYVKLMFQKCCICMQIVLKIIPSSICSESILGLKLAGLVTEVKVGGWHLG